MSSNFSLTKMVVMEGEPMLKENLSNTCLPQTSYISVRVFLTITKVSPNFMPVLETYDDSGSKINSGNMMQNLIQFAK